MKKKERFLIDKIPLIGKRSPIDIQTREKIKNTMLSLTAKTDETFMISSLVMKNQNQARSMVQSIKRDIRRKWKSQKNIQFACRTILDAGKKYVGTRVWRTN